MIRISYSGHRRCSCVPFGATASLRRKNARSCARQRQLLVQGTSYRCYSTRPNRKCIRTVARMNV